MKIKKYTCLAVLSAMPALAWAQESSTSDNNTSDNAVASNDTMVVTASRFPQPISTVLAPMDIVTREDINRWQVKSVTDVMRRLPGINITQYGGLGQLSDLYVRGSNSSHVLILIDGIRLNQAGVSGSSDLSQIPLSLVQRIEYIRGPRSAVYGSDAIGGVVNIITQPENGQTGSVLTAGIGSNGYQSYEGSTQQQLGDNTVVSLAGNYTYTKGFDVVAAGNTGGVAQPDRDGFMGKMLWGAVNHRFNDHLSGFFRAYGFDNRTAYDAAPSWDYPYALLDTRQLYSRNYNTGLRFQQGIYASQLIASYSKTKDYNYDPRYGMYDPSATLDDVDQYNLQWGNTFQMMKGTVSAGADWMRQSTAPGTGYVADGYTQNNTGLYLTTQQHISSVILEGSVRGDDHSQFGWHTTWQSSVGWEFTPGYRLIGSYGTAFKGPNLGQLYGSYGNTALQPEESKQWEAGLEGLSGGLSWRLSAYRNDIDQLIDYSSAANRYYNIGQAVIKGVEWTGSVTTGMFQHQLTLEYLDPRNAQTNEILLRRAKQQVKYQLDWQYVDIDWSINYRYLGVRYDQDFSSYPAEKVRLGGVSLWDIAASYPITEHLTVRGRIANLFDKDYETVYGYRTSGREYYLTGSYAF